MIGRVKKWLGIEGVKLELELPEEVKASGGVGKGTLRVQSMNAQTVTGAEIVLIEKYSRGRGKEKLIDEYELGKVRLDLQFEVPPEEILEVDFSLPFEMIQSEMDEFGSRNFIFRGIAGAAKSLRAARSEFRI